jgi:hypothetical protein
LPAPGATPSWPDHFRRPHERGHADPDAAADADVDEQSPIETLRADLAELERRLMVNDHEIDVLQVAAARRERKWFRDPTILTAVVAVVISLLSIAITQVNLRTDRQIQERSRLTALIQQLPAAQQQLAEKPGSSTEALALAAGDAAALMATVESSSFEKIEVAQALFFAGELGKAQELAQRGLAEAGSLLERVYASRMIAQVRYQAGDPVGGGAAYERTLDLLRQPETPVDSLVLRTYQTGVTEVMWAESEMRFGACGSAIGHMDKAKGQFAALRLQVIGVLQTTMENVQKATEQCPR